MNKKLLITLSVVFAAFVGGFIVYENMGNAAKTHYVNPVFEPVLADPTVVRADDGYFYAYGTEDAWGEKVESKLIPIVRSTNLIDWEYVGEAFKKKPDWKPAGGLWAPDISRFNGKYYLYYSFSLWGDPDPGIGVATSEKPEGPFQDHGKLFLSSEIGVNNSIDPQLFVTDDGTPYLFWGSFHGIYGVQLSKDGFSTVGKKFQIAGDTYEGAFLFKKNGHFYFFGSRGSCCEGADSTYHVAVGRSDSLKGPYVDKNGVKLTEYGGTDVLKAREDGKFVGPGHITVVTDDAGQDWMLYHAIDKKDPLLWNGATRRPLMLDRIIWKDGWPLIRGKSPSETKQEGPVIR
ncbi:MAG TPA: family 43 glycosylhydrolase [Bacillales bacterium]|nr:family 43 glycosylhydrolase [Bacillales bacterium]